MLFIVESPLKANKIKNYGYESIYTLGHITEIDTNLSSNIDNIKIIPKKNNYSFIENKIKNAKKVIIATDPDQEGESIAYVIAQICQKYKINYIRNPLYGLSNKKISDVINLNNQRQINSNIVKSVFSRQVMDSMLSKTFTTIAKKELNIDNFKLGRIQHNILLLLSMFKNFKRYSINNFKFLLKDNIKSLNYKIEKNSKIMKVSKPFNTGSVIENFINFEDFSIAKTSKFLQKLYIHNFITYPRTNGLAMEQDSFNLLFLKAKKIYNVDYYYYDNNYENAISPLKLEIDLNGDINKLFNLIMRNSIGYLIKPYIIDKINYSIIMKNDKKFKFTLGLDNKNILSNIFLPYDVFDNDKNLNKYLFLGEGIDEFFLIKILNMLNTIRPSTLGYIIEVLEKKELIEKTYTGEIILQPIAEEILSAINKELPFLNIEFYQNLSNDIIFIEKGINDFKFPILKLNKYLKDNNYNINNIDFNNKEEEIEYKKLWFYEEENNNNFINSQFDRKF